MLAALDAGLTILAPNSELATVLIDAVARHHRAAGREVWPTPRVRDFGSWLREQHLRRQLSGAATLRVLQDLEERELWRALVLADERSEAMLEPAAAAAAARSGRRAAYQYGIPLAAIDAYATEETRLLVDWMRRFDRRCRALGCISGDELLATFETAPEPMAWLDSPAWRPAARRWLIQHAAKKIMPAAVGPAAAALHHAASPELELAVAAAWASAQLQTSGGFRAWICVPDLNRRRAEVNDAFDATLALSRFRLERTDGIAPYAVAGGTPLAQYAPVGAALEMLSLAHGEVDFVRFSAVLRSPELQIETGDAAAAALLDIELRRRAPSELPLRAWLSLAQNLVRERSLAPVAALGRLASALENLERHRGAQPLSLWAGIWVAAWEQGPWAGRGRWVSAEFQAAERLRELVATLGAADQLFGSQTRAAAERLLNSAARDTMFQPQTGVPAIWISGQMSDPWLNFDALWIAGMTNDAWPPPVDPIPLLPVPLQRAYGVVSAAAEPQRLAAREIQALWAQRAPLAVFSWADPGEGRTGAPSPLLPADGRPLDDGIAQPQPHWRAALRAAPGLEQVRDSRAPQFGAGEQTRGIATLRAQSRCPFRGFAETRLGSDRLRRPAPGFNELERGNLLHAALEHLWSSLAGAAELRALDSRAQAQLVGGCVARAIAQVCANRDPGQRWRERERLRMQRVLNQWLAVELRRAEFSIERLELDRQVARLAGVDFIFRVDRIDRLADGARVLIDYKSGLAEADWRGDRPDNPQLPVYALLHHEGLVAVAYGQVNAAECRFVAESARAGVFEPGRRATRLEGTANFTELIDLWRERVERLAGDFRDGYAAVDPTPRACKSCHLQGLCRIGTEASADDEV